MNICNIKLFQLERVHLKIGKSGTGWYVWSCWSLWCGKKTLGSKSLGCPLPHILLPHCNHIINRWWWCWWGCDVPGQLKVLLLLCFRWYWRKHQLLYFNYFTRITDGNDSYNTHYYSSKRLGKSETVCSISCHQCGHGNVVRTHLLWENDCLHLPLGWSFIL